jgi:hypothetical protein
MDWKSGLPDDIKQHLINHQQTRAALELMKRRGITIDYARELVGQWLFEHAHTAPSDNA